MASYGNTVLTSAGLDLAQRNLSGTTSFTITKVATSSDASLINATISQITGLSTLPSVVQTGTVTAFDTSNPKQVGLKAKFTNDGLAAGYKICAVGVYAKETGKTSEVLYAVAPAIVPEEMPARPDSNTASFNFTLQIFMAVGNPSTVTVSATTEGVVKSINGSIKPDANGDLALSVGGRNLLTGTKTLSGVWNGDTETVDGFTVAKATQTQSNSSSFGEYDLIAWGLTTIKPNTNYVLTFYAKASKQTQIKSHLFDIGAVGAYKDGLTFNTLTTDYQRIAVHFHTDAIPAGRTITCLPVRSTEVGVTVWAYGFQLEEGNIATQWQPNPDDTDQAISKVSADLANEATARTNGDNSVLSQAKAYTDDAKSDIDSKLSDAKGQISALQQTTSGLQSTVSDQSGKISQLQQTASGLQSTVSNIRVGGRNLLTDTRTLSAWTNEHNGWTDTGQTFQGGEIWQCNQNNPWAKLYEYYEVKAGETYTFSVYLRSATTETNNACLFVSTNADPENGKASAQPSPDSVMFFAITNVWKRYSLTFTTQKDGIIKPRVEPGNGANDTAQMALPKLEVGNVATDWSPAPEDIDQAIASEATARSNGDTSVLSQAKAYTDTAKSDLTTAMTKADASVLGQANAYTDNAVRTVWTPTVITTAIDLNNIKACGSYFIQNTLGTTTNTPIPNSWLYVRVEGVPNRLVQTIWKDIDPASQWLRVYTGSWGNWVQITKAI